MISDSIHSFLTDFSQDKLYNLLTDDLQSHGYKYHKINIFNKNIDSPMQKIWVRVPKVKIIRPIFASSNSSGNNKSIPMTIILSPNTRTINRFYMFIKRIERRVIKIVHAATDNNKLVIKSSIRSSDGFDPMMCLRLPFRSHVDKDDSCFEFSFHIYNHLNKRITPSRIQSGNFISAFIELSEVWIGEKEFGINWTVLQLKVYPDFNFNICLFDDELEEESTGQYNDECYHCLYCPNQHVRTHMCSSSSLSPPPPPPPPIFNPIITHTPSSYTPRTNQSTHQSPSIQPSGFIPSIQDLQSIKSRLKRIDVDNDNNGTNNHNLPNNYGSLVPTLYDILETKDNLRSTTNTHADIDKYMKNIITDIKKLNDNKKPARKLSFNIDLILNS